MSTQSKTTKAVWVAGMLVAGLVAATAKTQASDVQRQPRNIQVAEYGLDFNSDDTMNEFLAEIQAVRNVAGAEAVENVLEDIENQFDFYSLAAQTADIDAGFISAEEYNIDADRVTDPVLMSLLNPDLEIGVGGSIFKIMGDYVVEITDGDLDTLDWLRDVQRERRFNMEEFGEDTDVIEMLSDVQRQPRVEMEEYGQNDSDIDWYAEPQAQGRQNIVVHEWNTNNGDIENYSTVSRPGSRFAAEEAGHDDDIAYLSEPTRAGRNIQAEEYDTTGLPSVFSGPVQQGRNVGSVEEYNDELGDGLASHQ